MDNYIKAIKDRIALARRCLPLFNGNAALKLQLEGEILKFEQFDSESVHPRSFSSSPSTSNSRPSATNTHSCQSDTNSRPSVATGPCPARSRHGQQSRSAHPSSARLLGCRTASRCACPKLSPAPVPAPSQRRT